MTDDTMAATSAAPLVHIGLLHAADEGDAAHLARLQAARDTLVQALTRQFPRFAWQVTLLQRRRFSPLGAVDPLALLEFAVQEKLARRWDYVVVLVPNELEARDRATTWGIPSSALEAAVVSTGMVASVDALADDVAAMSLHLLGHLWGLEHDDDGPMFPAERPDELRRTPFPEHQQTSVAERLEDVADARIEERRRRLKRLAFYWQTLRADPRGILTDIWGYAPWTLPFRLGRLTAGAVTFVIILMLTAESWEVGVNLSSSVIATATAAAILAAAIFLFVGQNLGKMSGPGQWHEQLVRTQFVIFFTLLGGMAALWVVLAVTALAVGFGMPAAVLAKWLAVAPDAAALGRYAAFMATLGLFGGALGGNLEDERNFKAKFLFDQES